jgi:hypothetical protein
MNNSHTTPCAAHVKASLLGAGLTIPITDGSFHLGTWQGIWLCEHRDHPCTRFHLALHQRDKAKADHQLYLRGCVALRVCCVWLESTQPRVTLW